MVRCEHCLRLYISRCCVLYVARAQGVPLIATSPVRHELPQSMQPTPVEVHKYTAPWHDLISDPTSPSHLDDVPSPPPGGVMGDLQCASDTLVPGTLGLLDQPAAAAHALSSCDSLAESFDDDTVVSFDDLSDVATW